MEKEEILEKSRSENKNRDIAGIEAINRASGAAAIVGAALCMVISVLDWQLTKTVNWACWTVDFGILSVLNVIKYIKLRRGSALALAVVCVVLFAFFAYG